MLVPVSVRHPRRAALDALVARHEDAPFTYPYVGATAGPPPAGYRPGHHEVELGGGDAVFARAAEGLRRWAAHRRSGASVHPPSAPVAEGQVVAVSVPVGPVWVTVVNRVVRVTDEADAFGFAYGTLRHHVVEGEEAFAVRRDAGGTVRFEVVSFIRPRGRALALAGPVIAPLDHRLVRRYLGGMQAFVAGGG